MAEELIYSESTFRDTLISLINCRLKGSISQNELTAWLLAVRVDGQPLSEAHLRCINGPVCLLATVIRAGTGPLVTSSTSSDTQPERT